MRRFDRFALSAVVLCAFSPLLALGFLFGAVLVPLGAGIVWGWATVHRWVSTLIGRNEQ